MPLRGGMSFLETLGHSYKDRERIPFKVWVLVVSGRYMKDYRKEDCKNKMIYCPSEVLKNKDLAIVRISWGER